MKADPFLDEMNQYITKNEKEYDIDYVELGGRDDSAKIYYGIKLMRGNQDGD